MTVVCITGASAGIGAACAKRFVENGAKVLLLARREDRLRDFQAQYGDDRVWTGVLDVRRREEVIATFESLPPEWQEIDVLINNAGLGRGRDSFVDAAIDDWEEMIDTNIKGLLYVSKAVIPGMIKRGRGQIIQIGSAAAHDPYPGGSVYCGTKSFVRILSRALKMDLLGTPIRVSSIDPGLVETDFSRVRFHGDEQKAKSVYDGLTPLSADDVADVVHFCATRPPHVNISEVLLLCTDQAAAAMAYRRKAE